MKVSARVDTGRFHRVEQILAHARRRAIARLEAQRGAEAERRAREIDSAGTRNKT